jgi:hypothetical protein
MYRDSATALDEHDRAVGAILIGEALIDECDRAVTRAGTRPPEERWRSFAEVNDAYPEIWRHLDRARRVLSSRGTNTAAYDELRPSTRVAATTLDREGNHAIDQAALDDAKRAIDELKLAVPGADWTAIEARTQGLIHAPLARHRRHRMMIAGVIAGFAFAVLAWLLAIVPEHKPNRTAVMRRELSEIQQQRKLRIELLNVELGSRCDPARVHELMRLLVLDGRGLDATRYADGYTARCGEDPVVEHWAAAPRPPRD